MSDDGSSTSGGFNLGNAKGTTSNTYIGEDQNQRPLEDLMRAMGGLATQSMNQRNALYGYPQTSTSGGGGGGGNGGGGAGGGGGTSGGHHEYGGTGTGAVVPGWTQTQGGVGPNGQPLHPPFVGAGPSTVGILPIYNPFPTDKPPGGGGGGKGGGLELDSASRSMGISGGGGNATAGAPGGSSQYRGGTTYADLQKFGAMTGRPVAQLDQAGAQRYDAITQALIQSGDYDHMGTQASAMVAKAAAQGMSPEQVVSSIGGSRGGASSYDLSSSHSGGMEGWNSLFGIGGDKTKGLTIYGGQGGDPGGGGSAQMATSDRSATVPGDGGGGGGFTPVGPRGGGGTGTYGGIGTGANVGGGSDPILTVGPKGTDPTDNPYQPGGPKYDPNSTVGQPGAWGGIPIDTAATGTPTGGLFGGYSQMASGQLPAAYEGALRRTGMDAARASADANRDRIERTAASTGSSAGRYAALADVARSETQTLGQQARQNTIQLEQDRQQRRVTGLGGLNSLYGQENQNMLSLLGMLGQIGQTKREVHNDGTNFGAGTSI